MFRSLMTKSAVAIAVAGISTFSAVSAQAVTSLGKTTLEFPVAGNGLCAQGTVGPATQCYGAMQGNPASGPNQAKILTDLNVNNIFGDINDWKFDSSVNPGGFGNNNPNSLGLVTSGLNFNATTGTFRFTNLSPAITNIVIAIHASNEFSTYFFPKGTLLNNTVYSFNTAGMKTGGGGPNAGNTPNLSNFNVFYQVPTPALLPGLIGLGIAALRKKEEESEEPIN